MKIFTLFAVFAILATFCSLSFSAVESSKPSTHNSQWIYKHGQAAKADDRECFACHDERVECIACHEDMPPRNHDIAWVQKNHGLESRFNRMKCQTCHRQDFCDACHETAYPMSHRNPRFGTGAGHCQTSCQLPHGVWRNTPAKNCIICHRTRPVINNGGIHPMG